MAEAEVRAPLYISSRLMAALKLPAGVGVLHLSAMDRDSEGRITYQYVIEDGAGRELYTGDDLHSGVGADVDYTDAMRSLLSFLGAAAEAYGHEMRNGVGSSENGEMFPPNVMDWCYLNENALYDVALDFDEAEVP